MLHRPRLAILAVVAVLALSLPACSGGGGADTVTGGSPQPVASPSPSPSEPGPPAQAADDMVELVRAWYEKADPNVCDRMTERMLDYGWGKSGEAGLLECRTNLEGSDPVEGVRVEAPSISGSRATVDVAYGPADDRKIDQLVFVLVEGTWQIDDISLVGPEPTG